METKPFLIEFTIQGNYPKTDIALVYGKDYEDAMRVLYKEYNLNGKLIVTRSLTVIENIPEPKITGQKVEKYNVDLNIGETIKFPEMDGKEYLITKTVKNCFGTLEEINLMLKPNVSDFKTPYIPSEKLLQELGFKKYDDAFVKGKYWYVNNAVRKNYLVDYVNDSHRPVEFKNEIEFKNLVWNDYYNENLKCFGLVLDHVKTLIAMFEGYAYWDKSKCLTWLKEYMSEVC